MEKTTKPTTTYGDMIKKAQIAPFLNLNEDDPFDIVSENEEGLIMVHYRNDADLEIFKHLRGIVVDSKNGKVISSSFPHAPKIVSSNLKIEDGNLIFGNVAIPENAARIKAGFEGTLIHVFKHGGKVYRSTRKRLDPSKSRWGKSKTFGEMYWDLSGPEDNVLFDETKNYSPYCHSFILVHPDVLVASKEDVGEGYLVYLGPKKMYTTTQDRCPYPLDEVDCDLRVPETHTRKTTSENQGKIYSPEILNLEDANKHLMFGFYQPFEEFSQMDIRLLPGEFVIVENTKTGDMFRVESPAYFWRSEMRNNNPNLMHRFYELIDYSYLKNENNQKFLDVFPILIPYAKESIEEYLPVIVWPQNIEHKNFSVLATRESKLYNIWEAFLMAVPIHRQKEVIEFYESLEAKRNELIAWLIETSKNISNLNIVDYSKRAQDILDKTRTFAEDQFRKGKNMNRRTKEFKTVEVMTKDNIRNFISKEQGNSLYRLIREMDRFKNPPLVDEK